MRHLRRYGAGLLFLAWSLTAAAATPPGVQLFTVLDRAVVAVGEPFEVRIVAYLPAGAPAFEAAFRAGRFAAPFDGLALIRRDLLPVRERPTAAGTVRVLTLRYTLRARRAGRVQIPAFRVPGGMPALDTPPRVLHAYQVTPSFYAARWAVVPVVAEAPASEAGRVIRRTGSAFLAAPDAFVTGYHVVMGAHRVWLTLPGGRRIRVKKAWAVDPVRDVVVLYVDPAEVRQAGLKPLRLAP